MMIADGSISIKNPTMAQSHIQPNRRILIVDDIQTIHDDFRKVLAAGPSQTCSLDDLKNRLFAVESQPALEKHFEIDSACQGKEGLEKVRRAIAEGRPYALAFIDARMPPGWDGIETISKICRVDGDLQIVLCTAYSDYSWEEIQSRLPVSDRLLILKKPFDPTEVLQLAAALTEKWRLAQECKGWIEALERAFQARTAELNREVVERKLAEKNLRNSQALLIQQERLAAIGQTAAGVAHEFNNILTIIQGHASMLMMNSSSFNPDDRESLQEINTGAERASAIINQLAGLHRQPSIHKKPIQVEAVIAPMATFLPSLLGEKISLKFHCGSNLPLIHGDAESLEQIILNLAENARDAMPHGGHLAVDASLVTVDPIEGDHHPDAVFGECLCLRIGDTGCGIAPEHLPRIFEPYSSAKAGCGIGLGLATVHGLVKQLQGWITVDSRINEGTTFKIFIPTAPACLAAPRETCHAG